MWTTQPRGQEKSAPGDTDRRQPGTPKLVDLSGERQETFDLYGIGDATTDRNGRACLLARRLSEAGVRFVEKMTVKAWDHDAKIATELPPRCASVDKPVVGLIKDLQRRGLLDETLVVCSGEFGRSHWSQDTSGTSPCESNGREHQQESACAWMADGGVNAGFTYGATDDFGFLPIEGKAHLHDLPATMLHLPGLDHEELTYHHAGRD